MESLALEISTSSNIWPDIAVASATFLVVFVALFQEWIKNNIWNRSKLKISISPVSPDCHKIEFRGDNGNFIQNGIYLRVQVKNIGRKPAENVEVMISKLWKINEFGNKDLMKTFLPMNLAWSHYRTSNIRIPVGVFRHCDIGYIKDTLTYDGTGLGTKMKFDTIIQPNRVSEDVYPNIVDPGKYKFELIISSDNSKSKNSFWNLYFDEIWTEDEEEMLTNHIKIEKVKF